MDLLDDSGDEANTGRSEEVDENILLNSDDEEGGVTKHPYIFQNSINEEELLYEGDEDEEYLEETEDVLDLELGDEELGTPDPLLESHDIAPVKFRANTFHSESHEESYQDSREIDEGHNQSQHEMSLLSSDGDGGDRHNADSPPPQDSMTHDQSTADSDDDDESPRHRSRFLTERKTEDISKHSISSEGKPITTLGERNLRLGHGQNLDSRRGRGGFSNMRGHGPRHINPRGMSMMGGNPHQRQQRPPSLLGDRPRPGLLRFPNFNQQIPSHPQGGHPIHQLPGGFIDFNHPIRQPSKSPVRNINPQSIQSSQKPQGQGQGPAPPSQNNVMSNNIQNQMAPAKPTGTGQNVNMINKPVQITSGGAPRAATTLSPKRPALGPRQPLVRQMRPRVQAPGPQNPFMGPPNSGPLPRNGGPVHRQPQQQFRPRGVQQQQQQQQQWHPNPNNPQQQMAPPQHQQHLGPRGPILVIRPGSQQMINRRLEPPDQFNNFNGPMGLMGPHPQQQPGPPINPFHDGFQNIRQPFPPQPRFSPPDEMMHPNGVISGPPGQLPILPMHNQQLPPGGPGPGPHHPFMPPQQQNFPPPSQELPLHPQQHPPPHQHPNNPFYPPMRQGGDMHRARSPQMNFGQGPPPPQSQSHQHPQQARFPPPGQEQPQQHGHGPPMHELGLHLPNQNQQTQFQPNQQKLNNRPNPFRPVPQELPQHPNQHQQQQLSYHPEPGRPNPFFPDGGRSVSIEPNLSNGEYNDPHGNYYSNSGSGDEPRYRERERDLYDRERDTYDRERNNYDRERDVYDRERDSYDRDRDSYRERERDRDRDRDRYYDYESSSSTRDYRERRERDDNYYEDSRSSQSRLPLKRGGEFRDEYSSAPDRKKYASPEKRLDGRLGPPVAKQADRFEDNSKQDEVIKIIKESQKVMGLDADYLRKIEEQKAMRAQILQEKEHRRKKQQQNSSQSQTQNQNQSSQAPSTEDNSRREVRILTSGKSGSGTGGQPRPQQQSVKPKVNTNAGNLQRVGAGGGRQETRVADSSEIPSSSSSSNKSIYVNPRAFHGDLSILNSNLKMINMNVRSVGGGSRSADAATGQGRSSNNGSYAVNPSNGSAPPGRQAVGASSGTVTSAASGTSTATNTGVARKRTILRIVRNKKGDIISKSKVIVLPKGSLLGGSTTSQ